MLSHRTFVTWFLALACTGILGSVPQAGGPSLLPCEGGVGHGSWDLPVTSGGNGFLDGILFADTSNVERYAFSGLLTDIPSPCLSCIEGRINGELDDGFGPAPDYVVCGRYLGSFFTGNGNFSVRVFPPGSNIAVGKIAGTFDDYPANDGPGTFQARWRICD